MTNGPFKNNFQNCKFCKFEFYWISMPSVFLMFNPNKLVGPRKRGGFFGKNHPSISPLFILKLNSGVALVFQDNVFIL